MIVPIEEKPDLDKYEVFEEVGHGGMATVYRGVDRRLGREVAIKIIHRHLRENKEVAARFVSEARAVAKVKHPNIVEVYDVSDEADDERYLVVELVRGSTLRELLTEHGHMPAEVAAAVGVEIAAGLEHAHQQDVVHRDVKPENVLVELPRAPISSRRGAESSDSNPSFAKVKITDFGIAKLLDAQGVTSTGQVLGSPAHMAPEQIEGGEVSARADVFGLGVLLYECMVGKLPFDGKNPAQVLRRVLDGKFTPADRARPTVGGQFGRILSKALANDAADRYESAADLAAALRAELKALEFDDPRREIDDYLNDPKGYWQGYEERIVGRLASRGRQARTEGNVTEAAACFNRALAFRPDDENLLDEVAGLARGERLKRALARTGVILALSVVLGGVAYGITRYTRNTEPVLNPTPEQPVKRDDNRARGTATNEAVTPPAPDKPEATAKAEKSAPRAKRRPRLKAATAPVPKARGSRQVNVIISGARGSSLLIDGSKREWFNTPHDLEVGKTYRFEAVPPNDECCVKPKAQVVRVEEGPGPQSVNFHVQFRDAVLSFAGPGGATMSCASLGFDAMPPGQRTIPMDKPVATAVCTVIPPPSSGSPPEQKKVTLRPGATFTVSAF